MIGSRVADADVPGGIHDHPIPKIIASEVECITSPRDNVKPIRIRRLNVSFCAASVQFNAHSIYMQGPSRTRRPDSHIPPLEDSGIVRVGSGDVHVETGCGGRAAGITGHVEVEADGVYRASRRARSRHVEVETCECICTGCHDAGVGDSEFQSFRGSRRRAGRRGDDIEDGGWRCGTDTDVAASDNRHCSGERSTVSLRNELNLPTFYTC